MTDDASEAVEPGSETRRWFQERVETNLRLFYYVASQVLDRSDDVEDAVQDGIVKALTHLRGLRNRDLLVPWIARIVKHTALDSRRRLRRSASALEEVGSIAHRPGEVGPENALQSVEAAFAIKSGLSRLPERYQLVLVLRFMEGLSPSEIAERMGIQSGNARVLLYRALEALRQQPQLGSHYDG